MPGHALVSGGSIGGLFAATALAKAGWKVDIFERTAVELAGRGAGIVTHPELIDALTRVGADISDLGVAVEDRVAFDINGQVVARTPYPQIVTSWDRIHQMLRACVPDTSHHLGRAITGYTQTEDAVTAVFSDGSRQTADLLVGADGFRSAIRGQMLPDVQPAYAGYVVWRALANEADLPRDVHANLFDRFGFFLPTGTQIVGYPIAGPGNDLRPGHRRYNFVWYAGVPKDQLADMLTDATGTRHTLSIPPPLVRDDVLDAMEANAAARLPTPFLDMLKISERPFFTPIYDHLSPVMHQGRVALSGDAACVARPHVGMGVTKAALDALALADALASAPLPQALADYSATRVPAARRAHGRAQRLGTYIFSKPPRGQNADGRNNANLDTIMRETAVVPS